MTLPMQVPSGSTSHQVVIEIGGIPIALQTTSADFVEILNGRYRDYVRAGVTVRVHVPRRVGSPRLVQSRRRRGGMVAERRMEVGTRRFPGELESGEAPGAVLQSANPYSIDSVLRIVHTLMLAPKGGFLLHASSAVRNGKAFLFSGVSEAGKTTMARLAPSDVVLLTDEASYVRKVGRPIHCLRHAICG